MEVELTTNKYEKYTSNLADMIEIVDNEPELKMIYSGIKEGSVGFVFGPSKSGKTTFCEALGMSIAAGADSFLGQPIDTGNKKVMVVSLEEHRHNRTKRNKLQSEYLMQTYSGNWTTDNYVVIKDEDFPRYIETPEQWKILEGTIESVKPGLVIIDSLTHLYNGSIEDSSVAKEVMKNLCSLADSTKTTIICIHHTHKMNDKAISMDTLAGSRVIGQEAEFLIGINRTSKGVRYIKEIAFRYKQEETDKVATFDVNENCWPVLKGDAYEYKLLAVTDGRVDDTKRTLIMEYFEDQEGEVATKDLETEFVDGEIMSKQTMFTALGQLVNDGSLNKPKKGIYKKAA